MKVPSDFDASTSGLGGFPRSMLCQCKLLSQFVCSQGMICSQADVPVRPWERLGLRTVKSSSVPLSRHSGRVGESPRFLEAVLESLFGIHVGISDTMGRPTPPCCRRVARGSKG